MWGVGRNTGGSHLYWRLVTGLEGRGRCVGCWAEYG